MHTNTKPVWYPHSTMLESQRKARSESVDTTLCGSLASCRGGGEWVIILRLSPAPPPLFPTSLLMPHDTHCGWSVSALASSEQDMHDVSEIECHARGPWMARGMKEGRDDRWSEIDKRARYTKEGWRETGGLKVLGRKRDKDGKEGSSEGGISTQRQIERDYFECQCCTLSAQA